MFDRACFASLTRRRRRKWNNGMMEYRVHPCLIWLKNNTVHGTCPPLPLTPSKTYRRLSPSDTKAWHSRSVRKLREFLVSGDLARTIVVTHHAPSIQSIVDRYRADPVSAAFASNMDDFILEHQPRLWIHGHTHESFDYKIR